MAAPRADGGFTIIEVMAALALLSTIAAGLTKTVVQAQRARVISEHWMQATQLAAEGVEQLCAGHALGPVRVGSNFERSGSVTAWTPHRGLYRVEVTVAWNDGEARTFQLVTLARR